MELTAGEWLDVMRNEYLERFIPAGGAAVKFVVPSSPIGYTRVRDELRTAAESNGLQFVWVDATQTKIHLIDRLFHDMARQLDWDFLTSSFLSNSLSGSGWKLPDRQEDLKLPVLAELNDYDQPVLRTEIGRLVGNLILKDYAMCREFRLAMYWLCDAQLNASDSLAMRDAIHGWLKGDLRRIATLKRALIFQRIARHNARHMLFSLAHWLKLAGKSGLLLALDVTRYGQDVRPAQRDGSNYYSTAAALDAYEVLRQLVDGTDEMFYRALP